MNQCTEGQTLYQSIPGGTYSRQIRETESVEAARVGSGEWKALCNSTEFQLGRWNKSWRGAVTLAVPRGGCT